MKTKKKIKKKLRIKGVIVILLLVYVFYQLTIFIINLHVDDVIITGNSILSDSEILNDSLITDDTKYLFLSSSSVENNVLNNPYIKSVDVSKVWFKDISISVEENKILFYYSYSGTLYLEGENQVENDSVVGVPALINYTPSDILSKFIVKLSLIDQDLINKISEIEYAPNIKDDVMLDEERFIFKMNDGNTVHVNIINLEKFSNYDSVLEIESSKGTLYLDSASDGNIFDIYD